MTRLAAALTAFLLATQVALAQTPQQDMRPGWLSEADELTLSRNLGAARTVIRNIAIDIFGAQPNLAPNEYRKLVENGVRTLPARLAAAEALKPESDPELARLKQQVLAATAQGRLAEAERSQVAFNQRFERFLAETRQNFDAQSLQQASNWESAARLAYAQASWRAAARYFGLAAEAAPESARQRRWELRLAQADALEQQGNRFDAAALTEAREIYETHALPLSGRSSAPRDWAVTQMHLGIVLRNIGEREGESGPQTLASSHNAFRLALEVATRAADPETWARIQMNLGNLLSDLSERQSGSEEYQTLMEARAAFESSLEVRTRASDPEGWALTKMNLGIVLRHLGDLQTGRQSVQTLLSAVQAYNDALQVYTPKSNPEDWAMTHMNAGVALYAVAERSSPSDSVGYFQASREAYERALQVYSPAMNPHEWAKTQMNHGNVLMRIAEPQAGAQRQSTILASRKAMENALTVFSPNNNPREWARAQINLSGILLALSEPQGSAESQQTLGTARDALLTALTVRTRASDPRGWANVQNSLGVVEDLIGDRGGGRAAYQRSASYYRAALEVLPDGYVRDAVLQNLVAVERKLGRGR